MDDVDANNDTSRLSYVLQSNHAYNSKKFKTSGVDHKIRIINAEGRSYLELAQQFHDLLTEVIDSLLIDTSDDALVRFVVHGSSLHTPLNTNFMERRGVSGNWFASFTAKMLQSHEYLDLDDNFIIHVIEIKQPTGSGRRCRKLLMKMGDNIVSKKSVIKYHYSQHLPCFGVAVYLAKIYAESKSRLPAILRGPICKHGVKEIYALFDKVSVEYGAVAACHWEQFQRVFGDHYRLIIINALNA
jgi:Mg2+ and Co2+ transporter CorA